MGTLLSRSSKVWSGSVLLEGVLDLFAGLLQVRFDLVNFAFGLEAVITRCLACGFLALTAKLFGGVVDLVTQTQGVPP